MQDGLCARADLIIFSALAATRDAQRSIRKARAACDAEDLPVLAMLQDASSDLRLALLNAGVDEVIEPWARPPLFLARIRALLRLRRRTSDLNPEAATGRALGFAEDTAPPGFVMQERIAVLGSDPRACETLCAAITRLTRAEARIWPCTALQGRVPEAPQPDVLIIDARRPSQPGNDAPWMRLIADLRSHEETRHVMQLILLEPDQGDQAALALDLGADEVIAAQVSAAEIAHRSGRLMRRKRRSEQFRDRVLSGLQAAVTDPLTGLHNRRFALSQLVGMSAHLVPLTAMVLDLDHFKAINDRHGHAAGDDALVGFANRLRRLVRPGDLLARLGGEEFLIALPNCAHDAARDRARSLCKAIAAQPFSSTHCDSLLNLTASIGVAVAGHALTGPEAAEQLLEEADRALFRAKSEGRNRVALSA
ncbi:MAG: hypothetical protein CSA72_12575 [Rhodobacterales bacterium]|nr:MAG: hypothetical protein CSA72_12575 [Rhodobacterales bacterium]